MYAKGDRPALVISTLEALAVLLALKTFFGGERKGHHTKVQIMPTWTDNQGNGSALNKMMTTRYPASAVIMEMSVFMKRHGLKALVEWTPRAGNREADELANGITNRFKPEYEVKINPEELQWYVLPKALEIGAQAEAEHQRAVDGGALPDRTKRQKKRKPEQRLRAADPW